MFGTDLLRGLTYLRPSTVIRRRISSHHPEHKNFDFLAIPRLQSRQIADISGAGCITHIWATTDCTDKNYLRKVLLKIYWDNEEEPSVLCPLGDFFGIGHGVSKNYWSLPLSMSPQDGKGFNCWWPMPFGTHARIEVCNETKRSLIFYFYVDYEEYPHLEGEIGRFHCQWRRVNPCEGIDDSLMDYTTFQMDGANTDFSKNYIILEAVGKGHYVGCHLDIHNLRIKEGDNWPGEGDDMMFIDDDPDLTLFGTGTEDYINTAWSPTQEFCTPFHGITMGGGLNHSGKVSYYRYHILDPVYFQKKIKVTIEHGHANRRYDDFASTAYWYQQEPHMSFSILNPEARIPREEPKEIPFTQ